MWLNHYCYCDSDTWRMVFLSVFLTFLQNHGKLKSTYKVSTSWLQRGNRSILIITILLLWWLDTVISQVSVWNETAVVSDETTSVRRDEVVVSFSAVDRAQSRVSRDRVSRRRALCRPSFDGLTFWLDVNAIVSEPFADRVLYLLSNVRDAKSVYQ